MDNDQNQEDVELQAEDQEDLDPREALFKKNMQAFERHAPGVASRLKAHKPIAKLKWFEKEDGDEDVSLEFGGETYFAGGAHAEAAMQLENLERYTKRAKMMMTVKGQVDPTADTAYVSFIERAEQSAIVPGENFMRDNCFYLFCFGVGLGCYLDAIMERTQCVVLILIEPNFEFLYQSLYVTDWGRIIPAALERGAIEFVFDPDPENTAEILQTMFRRHNPVSFDGTTLFRHYRSSYMSVAMDTFNERLLTSLMGLGYFQDEMNMIGQTYKNLEKGTSRLISEIKASPQIPAAIVANGPSLDKLIPVLKKNADKMIIFASGSVMKTLKEHGIDADFWVMTERVYFVLPMVEEVEEQHGVGDVVFIGSSTMYPGVIDPFKEVILFLRPGLSSTPLFKTKDDQIVSLPDPLAANSAAAAAGHLGFRQFYFFGVDVGSQFRKRGHAKGGFYAHPERDDGIPSLDIPVPGNFGGTVWTTSVLKWSRENLQRLILARSGRQFFNLSDGALIENATPLHPRSLKLNTPPRPKKEIVDEIAKRCAVYSKAEFEDRWDSVAIIDRLPAFSAKLKDIVQNGDLSQDLFVAKMCDALEPWAMTNPLAMLYRGTIFNLLIAFQWWNYRIVDENDRRVAQDIFKEEFGGMIDHMCERAIEIFEGLERGEDWTEFLK